MRQIVRNFRACRSLTLPSRTAVMRAESSSPSLREMTMVATPLPITLDQARASLMKRSMPRISAIPATGMVGTTDSVPTSAMKEAPVTPLAPLEVSMATVEYRDLLGEREIGVGGLRHEQGRERHVDRGAVGVEDVAGRYDQPHDRLRTAEPLQLLHEAGQNRIGRGRPEHDQDLFLDEEEELPDAEAGPPRDRTEHSEYEQGRREIETARQA